jgi:hypothetical protein
VPAVLQKGASSHGIDPRPPQRHPQGVEHLGRPSEVFGGVVAIGAVHGKEGQSKMATGDEGSHAELAGARQGVRIPHAGFRVSALACRDYGRHP